MLSGSSYLYVLCVLLQQHVHAFVHESEHQYMRAEVLADGLVQQPLPKESPHTVQTILSDSAKVKPEILDALPLHSDRMDAARTDPKVAALTLETSAMIAALAFLCYTWKSQSSRGVLPKFQSVLAVYVALNLCLQFLVKWEHEHREKDALQKSESSAPSMANTEGPTLARTLLITSLAEGLKLIVAQVMGKVRFPSYSPHAMKMMLLPALIYTANNTLAMYCVSVRALSSAVLWADTNIIFGALLWMAVFKKSISMECTIGLAFVMIGCGFDGLRTGDVNQVDWRIALSVLSAFLSSLGSVVMEKACKSDGLKDMDIHSLNSHLYFQTVMFGGIIMCAMLTFQGQSWGSSRDQLLQQLPAILRSFTPAAWLIVALQAMMGISVSCVLKQTDAVSKVVASCLRQPLVVVLAPIFVRETTSDFVSIASAILVACGCLVFFLAKQKPEESAMKIPEEDHITGKRPQRFTPAGQ